MTVKFTLQPPEVTKRLRKEFDHKRLNKVFVLWLYRTGQLNPYSHEINLIRASRGLAPSGFDVHHIVPLAGGGLNKFSNMCLIERSLHKFINKKCFDPALKNIKVGETVVVDVPDFPHVALRRDYNGWIDRTLQQSRDRNRFYQLLRRG